ncbi:MAG: hypothetical protein RRB24_01865 [Armatimonadota bacterium]|nr:hypothetical protein [Armatimonadota bacterium]MDT7971552.1 hypothetical protein [Armatimonadota bacterium]
MRRGEDEQPDATFVFAEKSAFHPTFCWSGYQPRKWQCIQGMIFPNLGERRWAGRRHWLLGANDPSKA